MTDDWLWPHFDTARSDVTATGEDLGVTRCPYCCFASCTHDWLRNQQPLLTATTDTADLIVANA